MKSFFLIKKPLKKEIPLFPPSRWRWFFLGLFIGVFSSLTTTVLYSFTEKIYRSLDEFAKVLHYVENDYVEPVNEQNLIEGAIKGMLETLDPHTLFLTPDIYRELKIDTVGKFGGVGLEVTLKDDLLTVVSALEGSPAWKAGIQPGDKIVKINGQSTKGMNLSDATKKMRGNRKTKVTVTLFRKGWKETKDFSLFRDTINIASVRSEMLPSGIGYIRITSFQERTSEDLNQTIQKLQKDSKGLQGIVLDLRNNPGGLLDQAVDAADLFVKDGVLVTIQGRNQKMDERKATGKAPYLEIPIAVLVNQGTASAAEILAGALQDYKRAFIIGTTTFGKGSVQTVIDLEENKGLKLTIAHYLTPLGRKIDGKGLTPDRVLKEENVEQHPETERSSEKQEDFFKKEAVRYLQRTKN